MQVPTIKLSELSQKAARSIIKASQRETTIGQQMHMTNYYAYLHSPNNAKSDFANYAKILLGK